MTKLSVDYSKAKACEWLSMALRSTFRDSLQSHPEQHPNHQSRLKAPGLERQERSAWMLLAKVVPPDKMRFGRTFLGFSSTTFPSRSSRLPQTMPEQVHFLTRVDKKAMMIGRVLRSD